MAVNLVEILVKATDETKAGFAESKASSQAAAAGMEDLAVAQDRVTAAELKLRDAEIQQADAQMRLEELAQSGVASDAELAAAQDKVTAATLRTADAQIRLGEADAKVVTAQRAAGDAALTTAAKTEESGSKSLLAGASLGKLGTMGSLALAGIGYESIKMAMSFQKSMELLVTQAGVPAKEMGTLKAGVLSLAGSVGFSPDSLAESMFHVASSMASLGTTAPQMLNVVKTAAEGAKVGNANLVDVTNALGAAIASGIPGVQNYSQAMGALNAIVGSGDMHMQDLAEAMGTGVLATVKGFGLSLKDVGAALATFGDNNIRGAQAATDLRMSVMALAVPATAGKAKLQEMGLSMTSLADTMRQHGLLAALEELKGHLAAAGVTAKEQGDVITQIFGKKAGTGLNVLMDQLDRLKSKYPDITAGANNFGKAWQDTQQTTKQKLDELRGTFEALGTSIGTKLLPVISGFATILLKLAPVLTALAPAILVIVAAMTAWAGIMKIIDILSDLNPWVLAIMAVVVAATLLIEHWNEVKHVAEVVFHAVTSAVETAFNWIKGHWPLLLAILTGPIGLAVKFIIDHWHQIVSGAESMIRDLVSWFTRLPGMIVHAVGDLGHLLWNAGASILRGLLGGIESMVGSVLGFVGHIASDIGGAFSSVLGIFSPSRVFEQHGKMIAAGLIQGMDGSKGLVTAAASRLARSTIPGQYPAAAGAGAGAGGGGVVIQFQPGGSGLDAMFMTWLKNSVRVQGGDPRMFNRKVAFQ